MVLGANTESACSFGGCCSFCQQEGDVVLKDYRLVHWEKHEQPTSVGSPSEPTKWGPLMWRCLEGESKKESKRKQWAPGHFTLRLAWQWW